MSLGCAGPAAHAESFFQLEAGIGAAHSADQGDDIWIQQGLGSHEQLNSFAWMVGVTGEPVNHLAWHIDFVDLGRVAAQTPAVGDSEYNTQTHQVIRGAAMPNYTVPFSGSGRTMGIALTLEPNYTWRGIRFGAEAGPFIYRATWNETVWNHDGTIMQIDHKPQIQVGYVLGASVGYKNFAVAYRFYADKTKWHPVPGLVSKTSTLMLTYRF